MTIAVHAVARVRAAPRVLAAFRAVPVARAGAPIALRHAPALRPRKAAKSLPRLVVPMRPSRQSNAYAKW